MQLIALGGDMRMNGLLRAARRAGVSCMQIRETDELGIMPQNADVIVLPWPRSFSGGMLAHTKIKREDVLCAVKHCDVLMMGDGDAEMAGRARVVCDPSQDETFLNDNAKLTAEGAVAAIMRADTLFGKCCVITGFGRIAKALVQRLCAMEAFVIVCARNEGQMQLAHRMGAHPLSLQQIALAAAQADIVINTVPARVFTAEALAQMKPGVRFVELASPPYGADPERAAQLGVSMEIMGGLPGKYAPQEAGEALYRALQRFLNVDKEKEES